MPSPEELLTYMRQNIRYGISTRDGRVYSVDDKDFDSIWQGDQAIVQSGDQLLVSEYGTCWDQVELERKWFSEHNYEFKTIFLWFEISSPNNYPTHTFLAYKTNDGWSWFEHAFEAGIYDFKNLDDLIEHVKSRILNSAIRDGVANRSDASLLKTYEYHKPKKYISIEEYINFVTGR